MPLACSDVLITAEAHGLTRRRDPPLTPHILLLSSSPCLPSSVAMRRQLTYSRPLLAQQCIWAVADRSDLAL